MKILHSVASIDPSLGGVSKAVTSIAESLTLLGSQNEIVSLDSKDLQIPLSTGIVHNCLGKGIGPWNFSPSLCEWLKKHALDYDAIIIHGLWLHHSHAVTKAVASHTKKALTVPRVFVMPHGMLDPWFQRDPSRRLKALRNWLFWKTVEHRVVSQADGMLFTCLQELELAKIPFTPYRPVGEYNVGLGIKSPPVLDNSMADAFRQTCPGISGRRYLLFLSRIHPKKGVDLLLRAYADVAKTLVDQEPPALVIAGPVDSEYARTMQKLALQLKIDDIFFPGMLQGEAKWGAFYGCDAFVLPSHQENFGIAVAEALACGKPVLISNQVNICVEIQNDNAGLVDNDTLEGTSNLLRTFLALTRLERSGFEGRARVCFAKHFGIESAAKKLLDAIQPDSST